MGRRGYLVRPLRYGSDEPYSRNNCLSGITGITDQDARRHPDRSIAHIQLDCLDVSVELFKKKRYSGNHLFLLCHKIPDKPGDHRCSA